MSEDHKKIDSPLYIRQRKTLLTVAIIISAVNLIGGEIMTDSNGQSSFSLPFGFAFDISRPWLIDWLLFLSLIYLVARYYVFAKDVRQLLIDKRDIEYRKIIKAMTGIDNDGNFRITHRFWFWVIVRQNFQRGIESEETFHPIPAKKTFRNSCITEWHLLFNTRTYSDYYSPYVMVAIALLSYLFK